jgi:ABC-type multidrug transport system, ATPase component
MLWGSNPKLLKMKSVEIYNICKSYGEAQVLKEISFLTDKGEMFGLIGPDGAGKTTLFRILTTLLLADSGTALVEGLDVVKKYKRVREIVGYMPGRFSLYGDLTVNENLNFFATLFHTTVKENYHLIENIFKQIAPFGNRRASALSGGMKQKLALSCALIHKPSVLFLDEPTTGVDPVSRKEFWQMLNALREEGITIIVSTPYMDEAVLCDRIALMSDGAFLEIETPANIIKEYKNKLLAVCGEDMPSLLKDLRSISFVKSAFSFGASHHVAMKEGVDDSTALSQELLRMGHIGFRVEEIAPSIEDCYMDKNAS